MKIEIREDPKFVPIVITITLSTYSEAKEFYHNYQKLCIIPKIYTELKKIGVI